MKEHEQQSEPRTLQAILGSRSFEELSESEQAEYLQRGNALSQGAVDALVKNLNRNTAANGH